MKFAENFFNKYKPLFSKGGKYEKYRPAFMAMYTFTFTPDETTEKGAHIRDSIDLKRVMFAVVLALIPATLFGMWNVGHQYFLQTGEAVSNFDQFMFGFWKVIPMIIVSYVVGLGIEFYFAIKRGHEVNEGYLVSGLLIPLIMPVTIPLWILAVSVAFAVVIGKEVFGGTGMNIVNPALLARAFAFFAYPTFMSGNKVWINIPESWVGNFEKMDAYSGETILGALGQGQEIAASWYDMFIGTIPGSIGETSVLMILIGAALLLLTKVASWRIMVSGFAGAALMGFIFNLWGANPLMQTPWWQHLLLGGLAFGVIFMATDPVTAAQTRKGKYIYGFFIGMLAIMIRVFNPAYPEGVMLAILLMNVVAPTIDFYVVQGNIKKRKKRFEKQAS
jgi:Na+-transporting NADH:ubiquinone oxidoreductase subunit B